MQYLVNGNLKHSGKQYATGETISLSEEMAESLLAIGVIEAVSESAVADEQTAEPEKKDKKRMKALSPDTREDDPSADL